MEKVITFCLVIVGLINLAPVIGILSAQHLEAAYDVSLKGNDLAILMRHRALLFGILGAFVIYSAFHPSLQPAAMIMVGASMLGFVWLVLTTAGYSQAIGKIFFMDLLGIFLLLIAIVLKYLFNSHSA